MNPTRTWTLGAVVAIIAILGGSFALGVQPQLAAASTADASTAEIDARNDTAVVELARLSRLAATESTLEATDAQLHRAVPTTLKLNIFTRDLRDLAASDQVTIQSIVPGEGVAYAAPASAAPVAKASASASASAPAAASATAVATDKSPWFGQTDALITGTNLTVVPVSVVVTGTDRAVLAYASDVQRSARLFHVSSVSTFLQDGVTTATLLGSIYSLDR